jgi:hypothetical protein
MPRFLVTYKLTDGSEFEGPPVMATDREAAGQQVRQLLAGDGPYAIVPDPDDSLLARVVPKERIALIGLRQQP